MTPAELREYARVMRDEGIFKYTLRVERNGPDEVVTIEMSQAAIAAAQAERHPAAAPNTVPVQPLPPPPSEEEEDRFAYMATEG